jgi:peptide/nickel transport system substrate-binding protein
MHKHSLMIAVSAVVLSTAALPAMAQDNQHILTANAEATTTWVRNFNPFSQTSMRFSTHDFIYEPLVVFNRIKDNEPNYRLAESFELAEDLMSITFTLREGLMWSDGEALTADDVVFTYDYLEAHPELDFVSIRPLFSSVEAIDERTIQFNLNEPNALIATQIVGMPIVPEHIWSEIDEPATFANEEPVGSGPLTEIARFTPQVYDQCRNPHYWDADNLAVDCMRWPQLADNTQVLAALAEGSLDWATSFIPDVENTFVGRDPENHHFWYTPSSLVSFSFNLETPDENNRKAFTDVQFRRAVSMLLNREDIVEIAGFGYPIVNDDPTTLGELYADWIDPEVVEEFGQYTQFDPEAATALLDEAGYVDANNDGFRDNPDGTPITITLMVPNGWTDWIDAVTIVSEDMQAAGLNVSISTPEAAVWTADLIEGRYSMTMNALGAAAMPWYAYNRAFNPGDEGVSRFVAQRFFDDELTELLADFPQTQDREEQGEIMNRAQRIVAENLPLLPVYNSPSFYQYNTSRFTGWANAEDPKFVPVVTNTNPARLLQLLDLEPVE